MLTIEHTIEANHNYLYAVADRLSRDSGKTFYVKNNGLVFPPEIGEGLFEYHTLDNGLSMVMLDCVFFEEVKLSRPAVITDYFYAVAFNLSSISLAVKLQGSTVKQHVGDCWTNKILCSSSGKGLEWVAPRNGRIRMVAIYMDKGWVQKKYKIARAPGNIPYVKEFKMDMPLQFTLDLDLEILMYLQDVLVTPPPSYLSNLYYKGEAKILLSLVVQRILKAPPKKMTLNYGDMATILLAVKEIENAWSKPLPSLEETAKKCLMSQSKFVMLFKALYGKNYVHFFNEKKMEKAEVLLLQKKETKVVANMLGFSNVSHFIKLFKEYYNQTPKRYLKTLKEKK